MRVEYRTPLPYQQIMDRMYAFGRYLMSHGVTVTWANNQATFHGSYMGVRFSGTAVVAPPVVIVEAQDPGFLWRGPAKSFLTRKLTEFLR